LQNHKNQFSKLIDR